MSNQNDIYLPVPQESKDTEVNAPADDIIETIIGCFGRYQTWLLFLITVGRLSTEYQVTNVVFLLPKLEFVCMDENAYNLTNHCPCESPQYSQSSIENSISSTWNLICDRNQLACLAQSSLHMGILIGSLIYGHISDRYGRKFGIIPALLSESIFVALSTLSSELWMFILLRFLIGTAVGGTLLCCYVFLIEIGGKSFRPYLTGLTELAYVSGYTTMPIIAYFIRDWKQLQLVTSLPWLFVIFYYFLIPESPRNNRPTENIQELVEKATLEIRQSSHIQQYGSYVDLFKTPKIRLYTLIMAFIWMCCSHTFYGMNQYIGRLQGNIYLNVLLSSICLFPGLVIHVLASLYLKRKVSIILSLISAGAALLLFIFIPSDMRAAELTLAIIGQIGARKGFVLAYLHASEVFPTVVRNSAFGFASVFARVGAFIAPFVVNIGIEWVSIVIFAGLTFCASLMCSFLPETKGIVLLNTIDETEKSKRRKF